MILEKGNMWDVFGHTDLFLITTNPVRRKDGAVVMGRGIAKEAKDRFPKLPYDFGRALDMLHPEIDQSHVGCLGEYDNQRIGWFMVKDHWASPAKLSIIEQSVFYLRHGYTWPHPERYRIDLNFPGIGNGKLSREEVLPLLENLPNSVHVWEYG